MVPLNSFLSDAVQPKRDLLNCRYSQINICLDKCLHVERLASWPMCRWMWVNADISLRDRLTVAARALGSQVRSPSNSPTWKVGVGDRELWFFSSSGTTVQAMGSRLLDWKWSPKYQITNMSSPLSILNTHRDTHTHTAQTKTSLFSITGASFLSTKKRTKRDQPLSLQHNVSSQSWDSLTMCFPTSEG